MKPSGFAKDVATVLVSDYKYRITKVKADYTIILYFSVESWSTDYVNHEIVKRISYYKIDESITLSIELSSLHKKYDGKWFHTLKDLKSKSLRGSYTRGILNEQLSKEYELKKIV